MLPIVEGTGSEILSKNLAVIYQNYFKLLRVSEMLTSYREMRAGSIILKKNNVDLIALCKNLIDTVSILTQEQGVRIRFSTSLGNADTEADFDRIEYVLLSIFANSLKHTKTGDDIKVTLSSTSSYYIVTVSISGAVIPEEQFPKVFEPSIHIHDEKHPEENFIGLGLAFSAKIIEDHGGSMLIESRAGQSTEIKFTLPIKNSGGLADAPVRYGEKGMVPILTYLSDVLPLDCYDAKFLD
jgi:signal transduction histidine kinase